MKEQMANIILQGIAGNIPVAGPFLSPLITDLLSQDKNKRLTEYMQGVEARLNKLEMENILTSNYLKRELFEEAIHIIIKTPHSSRVGQIIKVSVFALSLQDSLFNRDESSQILQVVAQLDEGNINLLQSIYENEECFTTDIEEDNLSLSHLEYLTLISKNYKQISKLSANQAGTQYTDALNSILDKLKRPDYKITSLGIEVLKYLDLIK
jgi:CRISPR/Cas system type I-B associated protein Csh2 (Cas7 group RAMP superfamily)